MTADAGFVIAAQGQDWIVQRAAAGGGLRIPLSHTLRDTPSTVNFAFGEGGNDVLFGNRGVDILHGGDDDDALYGLHGADRLIGGPGKDRLYGDGRPNAAGQLDELAVAEHGDDLLDGGDGDDQVIGGIRDDTHFGGEGHLWVAERLVPPSLRYTSKRRATFKELQKVIAMAMTPRQHPERS